MKTFYFLVSVMATCLFSSFAESEACEYAGSNIGYVKSQTQKAIDANDLNKAKFLTYKALGAIYKSRQQLKECGCDQAAIRVEESHHHLKLATKATSINGAKILLAEALAKTVASLEALEKHHLHEKPDTSKDLAMNSAAFENEVVTLEMGKTEDDVLHTLINDSLLNYEASLAKAVETVNCKDARAYASQIFKHCEQELLKPNLGEGKKYYNLRTQEITAEALEKLGDCGMVSGE